MMEALVEQSGHDLDISFVIEAANHNDRLACTLLYNAAVDLGRALSYIINLLGLEVVIIGGQIASGSELFFNTVIDEAKKHSLGLISEKVQFVREIPHEDAALIGALYMPIASFYKLPEYL